MRRRQGDGSDGEREKRGGEEKGRGERKRREGEGM